VAFLLLWLGSDAALKTIGYKRKKPEIALRLFVDFSKILARLAGFEPTTPWFVGRYEAKVPRVKRTDRPR
jgi:hypothetical protein